MSLFRRPKKAVRPRVVTINPDDDDEMDDLPPPVSSSTSSTSNGNSTKSSHSEPKSEKKKEKSEKKQTLLSFDEELEGDDGEVFKVKKSSVSRRLIKQRGKEKKSEPSSLYKRIEKIGDDASDIKLLTEGMSLKKSRSEAENKTDGSSSDKEFIRILNGREAEAVHLEDEDEEEDETEEVAMKFSFSAARRRETASEAVRMALERGQIPDANLIHEARKRRQMAREFSSSGAPEFIPVDTTQRYRKEQSRLVRDDDDNDRSGDDEDERINFSSATNADRIDRDKRREVFDAAQDEDRDVASAESDLEIDEWERQQIRKGVTQTQMQNVVKEVFQQQPYLYTADTSYVDSVYASYPPPPNAVEAATGSKREVKTQARTMNVDDIVSGNMKMTPDIVMGLLNDRLTKLRLSKEAHEGALSRMENDLKVIEEELTEAKAVKPALSSRFILYQNLRGYVTDLVDCLRCKVPNIEALENSMLDLMRAKAERLAERRRQDTKDQLEEVNASISILSGNPITVPPPNAGEAKTRRAAEREGRRTRRRRIREIKDIKGHKEGLSSDDEETELELNAIKLQKESIIREAGSLFDDVVEDFGTVEGILTRFQEWKKQDHETYKESYAFMCVPKCLGPLIRLDLLCWDPFEDDFNMLKFPWVKLLAAYAAPGDVSIEYLASDPDAKLIPDVAEKIIVPWITKVVQAKWDPMSASQTKKLVNVVRRCIDEWAVVPTCKTIQSLLSTVVSKFKDAVDNDVYIPLFPKTVMSNKCSPAYIFASRQFWSSVKLLDNMSSWAGLLSDKPLHVLALDALLTRYILLGLRTAPDLTDSCERAKGVVNVLPRAWLNRDPDTEVPNGLQQLTVCLVSIVQNTDFALAINRVAIPEIANVLKSIGSHEEAKLILHKYS